MNFADLKKIHENNALCIIGYKKINSDFIFIPK